MSRSLRTRLDRLETQNSPSGLVIEWAESEAEAEKKADDWRASGDPRELMVIRWKDDDEAPRPDDKSRVSPRLSQLG